MDAFTTQRLRATPIAEQDLDDLVQLHLDPAVSRFLGGVRSPEKTAAYLLTQREHWARHGFGLWTLRTDGGVFVGRAGLRHVEVAGQGELEIAYTLQRAWWGQGLASEVASALVGLWRSELAEQSLVGLVEKGNAASDRVLLKAGFEYERDDLLDGLSISVFRLTRTLSGTCSTGSEVEVGSGPGNGHSRLGVQRAVACPQWVDFGPLRN